MVMLSAQVAALHAEGGYRELVHQRAVAQREPVRGQHQRGLRHQQPLPRLGKRSRRERQHVPDDK